MMGVNYAHHYLADYELSKGIVQDAFMIIWERRKTLDLELHISSYLFSIIRNKCLNAIRDKLKKFKSYNSDAAMELLINQKALSDDSAAKVISEELDELFKSTMKDMPENIRSVFLMNRDEEMTYKEIADKLGLSEKAIEYRMGRALAILRTALADYLPAIFFIIIFRVLRFFV